MLQNTRSGAQLTVQLGGELDHYCAQSVRRELDTMLRDHTIRLLVLDFSNVTFMDSSGIGVVLGRYRIMRDRGGQVGVSHMNPHIARIFHMSGMDRVILLMDEMEVHG